MIHLGGGPKDGDFLAYIERVTGTPPTNPAEVVRTARQIAARQHAAARPSDTVSSAGAGRMVDAPADPAPRPAKDLGPSLSDIDLSLLVPIARGLTYVGFGVIAAAILLRDWFALSPFAGVVLIVLGALLRRIGRGTRRGARQPSLTRKT